jgi:hypothetical protein
VTNEYVDQDQRSEIGQKSFEPFAYIDAKDMRGEERAAHEGPGTQAEPAKETGTGNDRNEQIGE